MELVEIPLLELHPRFLAEGRHRYGQGVEFDCPGHRGLLGPESRGEGFNIDAAGRCRLQFWFADPDDGELPREDVLLYRHAYRAGALPFASLSLWRRQLVGISRMIEVPGHWAGVVLDGAVWRTRAG